MSKLVLIVDDSKTIRQQLSITLNKGGYQVVEAEDGLEGLKKYSENAGIAMVISDVNMPNMGGMDMVEAMQKNGVAVPIIMLTTEGSPDLIARAKAAGVKGWLVKPFQPEQLIGILTKLLG